MAHIRMLSHRKIFTHSVFSFGSKNTNAGAATPTAIGDKATLIDTGDKRISAGAAQLSTLAQSCLSPSPISPLSHRKMSGSE